MDLLRLFNNLDNKNGLKYYNKNVKIFPARLLDDKSSKSFGVKAILEEAFNSAISPLEEMKFQIYKIY